MTTSLPGRLAVRINSFSSSRQNAPPSSSFTMNFLNNIFKTIPATTTRSFGLTLITFSLVGFFYDGWIRLALAALAIFGLLLVTINRSPQNLFQTSVVIKFFGRFFGFQFENEATALPVVRHHIFYFVLGALLASSFYFLSPINFILLAGGVICTSLIFYKTEIGVLLAAFIIPIAPTIVIAGLMAVTVLSYVTKIFFIRRGEHQFNITGMLLAAIFFAVSVMFSIIVAYDSGNALFTAAMYTLFILFFIAAKNIIRTRRMLMAIIAILVLSGFLVAAYGIYQRVTGNFVETAAWIDDEMFGQTTARIYSTLENPNVLGQYLIIIIVFAFGMLYYYKNPVHILGILGILGVTALCMLFTQSRGAWLGLVLAFAFFAFFRDKRLLFLGLLAIIALPFLLPETVIQRFLSIGNMADTSTNFRVNIWLGSLAMIGTIWPSGIGMGTGNFVFVYQGYAFHAAEALHSHNLFLQIIIEQGIVGIILFAVLVFLFFKYTLIKPRESNDSFLKTASVALAAGMFGYLIQGLTDNVWYNYRIVSYFWLLMAISASLYTAVKNEVQEVQNEKTH
ncbi:MAG: O-antigen ligase family protein [Defluviitaleaceae bacterium]|nr:O-antigen ligase family protein [Defluviitaleaceae bacterium]